MTWRGRILENAEEDVAGWGERKKVKKKVQKLNEHVDSLVAARRRRPRRFSQNGCRHQTCQRGILVPAAHIFSMFIMGGIRRTPTQKHLEKCGQNVANPLFPTCVATLFLSLCCNLVILRADLFRLIFQLPICLTNNDF